jgi:mannose-6-phosphate isomerase-like protein (cupin superfamily)
MTITATNHVKVTRWRGGQHPTIDNITRQMKQEGLRPYVWSDDSNYRYPVRSHGYDKTLYCLRGSLEIILSTNKQRIVLRSGDRIDVPRGVRHAAIIGPAGAQCIEGGPF